MAANEDSKTGSALADTSIRSSSPRFLTVTEAAEILRTHRQTVYALIQRGRLAAVNVGTARRPAYRIGAAVLDELQRGGQISGVGSTCQKCSSSKGKIR